jgi:hypothetical protein
MSNYKSMMIPLMMEVEGVSRTLFFCPELKRLVAQEDFIKRSSGPTYSPNIYAALDTTD